MAHFVADTNGLWRGCHAGTKVRTQSQVFCTVGDNCATVFRGVVPGEIMDDMELLAQAASLAPVYVDGFGAFRKVNGVLRCIGWIIDGGAQLNLVVSLAGAEQGNRASRHALDGKPCAKAASIWKGRSLAH